MLIVDTTARVRCVNQACCALLQRGAAELVGLASVDLVHPEDREASEATLRLVHDRGVDRLDGLERRLLRPDGSVVWGRLSHRRLRDANGSPIGTVTTIEDITAGRLAMEALALRDEHDRAVFERASVGQLVAPADGLGITAANGALRALLGMAAAELTGRSLLDLVHPDDRPACSRDIDRLISGEATIVDAELRLVSGHGESVPARVTLAAGPGRDGAPMAITALIQDLRAQRCADRARREIGEHLTFQANHDALTGLANRSLFTQRLEAALRSRRGGLAVLFVDIDGFKVVNDRLGHSVGDHALFEIAARLTAALRPADCVARFGGDEFTILCEEIHNPHEVVEIAERIIAGIGEPMWLCGQRVQVGASVGISLPEGDVVTVETLLGQADTAMYRAKAAGRGRCVVFGDAAPLITRTRQQIGADLAEAVRRDELSLRYQPIVDTGSGALAGVEALCRWERDGQVVLPPSEFIPIAEETGLIDELGEWVLVEACRQAAEWRRTIGPTRPFYVSVNVSAKQLARPHFAAWVTSVLATAGLDPRSLVLELTESGLVEDVGLAKRILVEVRALGVRIAIDDFGAGYSSLGYLRSFAVDVVKIDRSFMQGLGHSAVAAAVVSTVMQLAGALRLTVVAEGVETAGQSRALSTLGCHVAQGYLYSKPRTAAEIGTTVATGTMSPGHGLTRAV
jgi:diguanylate cyclase (GGDEF)-like protein/PAS domain S-box-containing protein